MSLPHNYSFTRYLSAKKTVDDRALNCCVWQSLVQLLPPASPQRPLQVLEVGAGIGTMVERVLSWDLLDYAKYTAIDAQPENIAYARQRLPRWGRANGYQVFEGPTGLIFERGELQRVEVSLIAADLFDSAVLDPPRTGWDLLIASAFLDLVDVPTALALLFNLLGPAGLYYFTINFDGQTIFEPVIDRHLDPQILDLYHRSMDERLVAGSPSGNSRTGRHLFAHLRAAGGEILEAGGSDWVVYPGSAGYLHDEAYFLHFIIETIYRQLHAHPDLIAEDLASWAIERHAQIDRGELLYIAHQLDFLGKVSPS